MRRDALRRAKCGSAPSPRSSARGPSCGSSAAAGSTSDWPIWGCRDDLLAGLEELLAETAGAVLVSGPAGSGKTTTVYACLRELVRPRRRSRSLVSLEDPIEVAVPGVAQSQVNAAAGLDLATGLRFLMRQDPEVIMVGEIRDRATAEAAMQASLTGHLLLSTFHAGSAVETLGRLLDMGIEPYVLRSGLLAILCQRLLRRLCSCAVEIDDPQDCLGLPLARGLAAGRLRGVRRRAVIAGESCWRNARAEAGRGRRTGPCRAGPCRYHGAGAAGRPCGHDRALATGHPGGGKRSRPVPPRSAACWAWRQRLERVYCRRAAISTRSRAISRPHASLKTAGK